MTYPTREESAAMGRIRAQTRFHPDKPETVEADRAFLAERRRERHINKLVEELAAALTDEKRAKLVALFAPVESDGDAA